MNMSFLGHIRRCNNADLSQFEPWFVGSERAGFIHRDFAPELARRKEALESFPLDSMAMVGSLTRDNRRYALLRVDNLLYQIKSGDYLGQNFGRVTKISETEITLREVVQDAAGEWIERTSTLQLQEKGR